MRKAPVITFDGVGGSGKGTISQLLAKELGWHYLDSGALYRVVGYLALQVNIDFSDVDRLVKIAQNPPVTFKLLPSGVSIFHEDVDITPQIRTEKSGNAASIVGALPCVREALLLGQKSFRKEPGLVTDGRDMGSVVFKDAVLKFYLDASVEVRAKRRFKQLQEQGVDVKLASLLQELEERDHRDKTRAISPLVIPEGAVYIMTDDMSIEEVLNLVMENVKNMPAM